MKITTKTGDKGETSLFGGRRVSKSSAFIELVGELDELQAVVGWCGVELRDIPKNAITELPDILTRVIDDLYRMMSIVGFEFKCPGNIRLIDEADVEFLENEIEARQDAVRDLDGFVRPGGLEISARLHVARTVCRRVERGVVKMMGKMGDMDAQSCAYNVRTKSGDQSVPGNVLTGEANLDATRFILKYLNRLSDLLFILAYESEKLEQIKRIC